MAANRAGQGHRPHEAIRPHVTEEDFVKHRDHRDNAGPWDGVEYLRHSARARIAALGVNGLPKGKTKRPGISTVTETPLRRRCL